MEFHAEASSAFERIAKRDPQWLKQAGLCLCAAAGVGSTSFFHDWRLGCYAKGYTLGRNGDRVNW